MDKTRSATVGWVAPRLGLEGRLGLAGGLGLHGEAGLAVPLIPRPFVLDGIELHTPAPVALRLAAGLDVRF